MSAKPDDTRYGSLHGEPIRQRHVGLCPTSPCRPAVRRLDSTRSWYVLDFNLTSRIETAYRRWGLLVLRINRLQMKDFQFEKLFCEVGG